MSEIDLSKLGPAARVRPEPSFRGSIAAAAGSLAWAGLAFIGFDAWLTDDQPIVGILLGLLVVACGHVVILRLGEVVRPAGVAMITLGTLLAIGLIFDDVSSPAALLFVLFLAWGGQYVFGPATGSLPLFVGALFAAWMLMLDTAAGDGDGGSESIGGDLFFEAPVTPVTSGDDLTAYLSLVVGVLLLGATWALDRDGWRGTATGTVIVGDMAFLVGVFGVIGILDSDVLGALVVVAASTVLVWVGASGDRRLTTWLGALGVFVGFLGVLTTVFEFDDPVPFGIVAVLIGAAIVYLLTVLEVPEPGLPPDPDPDPDADNGGGGGGGGRGIPAVEVDAHEHAGTPDSLVEPEATPATTPDPPQDLSPAWQRDPTGRHELRWWNGTEWTPNVSDQGTASTDEGP